MALASRKAVAGAMLPWLARGLLIAGAIVLGVAAAEYVSGYYFQWQLRDAFRTGDPAGGGLSENPADRESREQETGLPWPAARPDGEDPPDVRAGDGETAEVPVRGAPLFRLMVPSIKLDTVVVYGTEEGTLRRAPGLIEETSLPGQGNTVIAGHRDLHFSRLGELKEGDVIYVQTDALRYGYVVSWRQIVEPDDLSVMQPTRDVRLSLVTCWPLRWIGPAPQRLVVTATLREKTVVRPEDGKQTNRAGR